MSRTPHAAARRRRSELEASVRRAFEEGLQEADRPRLKLLAKRWKRILARLRPLGGMSRGNAVDVFCDGDALFEALWEAIAGAEQRILLQTYTLADDRVGRRTLEELCAAAGRGLRVVLLYDAFGSIGLEAQELQDLRRLGGAVEVFNPAWAPLSRRRMVRDHRKVCVVDGRVGFCGGMNVSEDYAGERFGNGRFQDAHVRVQGPAARDLERLFDAEDAPEREPAQPASGGADVFVQVLESDRGRDRRAIQRAMRFTISRCESRAWLTSPYFLPPRRLRRALQRAARRGVDVRVITAGVSDVPIARAVGRHVYGRFLRAGVRIFEMRARTLHAKTAVIDGVYVSVGSFNLDLLSDRYNHEVNVSLLDRGLARALEGQYEASLAGSVEVTLDSLARRSVLERAAGWILYQLSRLL